MRLFPENWQIDIAENLCSEITDCINKTAPVVEQETPYLMIRTTNIKDGRVNLEGARYVTEQTFKKWTRRFLPKKNDVLLTREAPLGDVGLVRTEKQIFLGQRIMAYRANKKKLSQLFLYYSLIGPTLQSQIRMYGSGSTVEHMRVPDSKNLKLPFPPLPIQRKIAAILSAYDELIENNNRRIAILEKMAEEIYREWFVRLRFPGHDARDGRDRPRSVKGVPDGWEVKKIGEIIKSYIGGGWGEENQNISHPTGAYVIRGTDIPDLRVGKFALPPFRYHKNSNFASRAMKPGDIVFEVSGGSKDQLLGRSLLITNGIYNLCKGRVICASFCKMIRPSISSFFLNYFLQAFYQCGAVGTYQIQSTGISNYQFESFIKYQTIILPTSDLLTQFDKAIFPLNSEKDNLANKNRLLTESRDLLLPRLISGKLDVENLDIAFPPGMEEEASHA